MKNIASVKLCRRACVALWVVVNVLAIVALYSLPDYRVFVVLLMVVVLTPSYVFLTHWLDESYRWLGLRSLCRQAKTLPAKADGFRRTLRLEMLVITSGFAGTFFFLSIQLYFEIGPELRPPWVLETMAVLFFAACLLNLLQIVLYDFRLATRSEERAEFDELRRGVDRRLLRFRDFSWHALATPIVLAFALIDFTFCLVVNLVYGLVLFSYYFLSGDQRTLGFYDAKPATESAPVPSAGAPAPAASASASGAG